ncbi:MAG: 50S ribosomal protein L10 [Bdellovibrionota bacterium]|nr:50S ribosomal protein L10 [Pseudomonadota bacterium]MDY6089710.1 50S ribosomal protein L10 [Bdellovibrionota bacterium]
MNKADKIKEVEFVTDSLKASQVAICANYHGLSVSDINDLKKGLRKVGATCRVIKNTLSKISIDKALKEDGKEEEIGKFQGIFKGPSILISTSQDPVSMTKVVADFAKTHEALALKGAWFENAFIDVAGVKTLASMPSKEEVLAKLLNLLNTPATQLLRVIKASSEQVVRVVDAQRKKLAGE